MFSLLYEEYSFVKARNVVASLGRISGAVHWTMMVRTVD
jgi:hypothetical protein